MRALVGKGDRRRGIANEGMVDPGVGLGARETGLARGRREERIHSGIVEVRGVVHPCGSRNRRGSCRDRRDYQSPTSTARSQAAPGVSMSGPELVAREALHLDVDADRGEVLDDDLGCSAAAAPSKQ